jgi:hypothetical protein
MKSVRFALGSVILLGVMAAASLAGTGTSTRTWISSTGSDSNTCTPTSPCASFNGALAQTAPGGEVVVLDSGNYLPFSVTEAVTIEASPGVYAGITTTSGDGLDIAAGSTDRVVIKGLTFNNSGSSYGIIYQSGGALDVENCTMNGYKVALFFDGAGNLEVHNSTFSGNETGIKVQPAAAGQAYAMIDHVRLQQAPGSTASIGLDAADNSVVTIKNSLVSGYYKGLAALSITSYPAELNIENCVSSNNSIGVEAIASSTGTVMVRVSDSTVTDNGTGLYNQNVGPSTLLSRQNNTVEGNGTDEQGPITTFVAK